MLLAVALALRAALRRPLVRGMRSGMRGVVRLAFARRPVWPGALIAVVLAGAVRLAVLLLMLLAGMMPACALATSGVRLVPLGSAMRTCVTVR